MNMEATISKGNQFADSV